MVLMSRALVNSVLTKSQLTQHDYPMMKEFLINMTQTFATYVYSAYDDWKDNIKKNDPLLLHKIHKVLCGEHAYNPQGRRRRSADPASSVPRVQPRPRRQTGEAETKEELLRRSYGSRLGYECGLARMFEDPELEAGEAGKLYQARWLQCNWNKSWTPVDYIDTCTWTACIDPPQVSGDNHLYL